MHVEQGGLHQNHMLRQQKIQNLYQHEKELKRKRKEMELLEICFRLLITKTNISH